MSTGQALGFAGMAIGAAFGSPIGAQMGFLVGSLIGNLIDPPKIEGPRLHDLKLQLSTYGKVIPLVWGTGRIGGNVIDQTDLREHKQKSGGKGGPQVITYTYSASFDVLLCEGPIIGIRRIWADGRLIWDIETGDDCPCTVYRGEASQTPDPTFEAIHGVGNVPGYNGFAHVVFTDYYLTDFGNRIPQLEFEVYTNVGTFPFRVSNFNPMPDGVPAIADRSYEYSSGRIVVGNYKTASLANGHYYERVFDIHGVEDTSAAYDAEVYLPGFPAIPVHGLTAATDGLSWWYKENLITTITVNPFGGSSLGTGCGESQAIIYHEGYIYATGRGTLSGDVGIVRYPAAGGVITTETGTPDVWITVALAGAGLPLSNWVLGTSNRTDYVYLFHNGDFILYEYHGTLSGINRQWDLSALDAIQDIVNGVAFTVYENSNGDLIFACDRGTSGGKNAGVFYLNDDLTSTYVGQVDEIDGYIGPVDLLGNSAYALIADGVISLMPPVASVPLSQIVSELSERTPLGDSGSPTVYDTSELTDEVRWFAVAANMTVRNAIATLRPIFFFDAVESDDRVVFKKRGASSIATIPDADLCAHDYGAESPDPLLTVRKREQGLPRTVTLTYYDVDADYQTGAQSSPRQTTLSENDVILDVPVGLTAQEAASICWSVQSAEWIERETFEFSTTRKWAKLEPCDVVTVRGREIRIVTRSETPGGVFKFSGVLNAPSIYTQSAPGSSAAGFVPQEQSGSTVPTELVLLDIPILSQADSPFGFYAGMGPARSGRWPGATLYKSLDGGATYYAVAASVTPSVIGRTDDAPGSPSVSSVLASYSGGDVVDESEVCVVLTDENATLESISSTALTNGGNLCAISRGYAGSPATLQWELLQFRDATLVADRTYTLKGFLRGRKGTLTTDHADGDKFVLLPVTNVDAPEAELNLTLKYKAVTTGQSLAETAAQDFTNTGLSALEYYATENENLPVFVGDGGSPGGGVQGLVPAPEPGDCAAQKFLSACGVWSVPAGAGGSPSGGGSGVVNLTMPAGFVVSGSGTDTIDVTGGPAAQFIVAVADADLPNELVATSTGNIVVSAPGGSPSGQFIWDLTTTGVAAGGYGSSNDIPLFTVDAFGRLTSASSTPLVSRIIVEWSHVVVDTQSLALNFTGSVQVVDEGGGVTGINIDAIPANTGVVVVSQGSPQLSDARTLVAGSGITLTDAGAGSTLTVGVTSSVAKKVVQFACSDLLTPLTPGTNKAVFRMPYAMTLSEVRASLYVADSGSPVAGITIDINESGSSILSTKLTIDPGEKTSTTAATPAVISDASLADDAEITVDIDAVGGNAQGLVVCLIGD